ncbi:hypothetical protein GCM10009789_11100 [Kribbella sancticallisti]|uniref:Uncharacterized protein n=1 Tax=Kribbella sancticallisti TaxID=460087 RepID=A0ABN2CJ07_9ACTN
MLWWLLGQGARLELVRPALAAAYPDFDVDAEVDHVTMPDRAEWPAKDEQRRRDACAEFKRAAPGVKSGSAAMRAVRLAGVRRQRLASQVVDIDAVARKCDHKPLPL